MIPLYPDNLRLHYWPGDERQHVYVKIDGTDVGFLEVDSQRRAYSFTAEQAEDWPFVKFVYNVFNQAHDQATSAVVISRPS